MRRGGEGRIRTSEGNSQQIYSLPRLAASVPLRWSARRRLADRTPFVDAAPYFGPPIGIVRRVHRCATSLFVAQRFGRSEWVETKRDRAIVPRLERARGLEPLTCGLQTRRSTN